MAITISSLTPTNPSVFAGGSLTFSVSATTNIAGSSLAYLWQVSSNGTTWFDLPNNGASSITISNIQATSNNDQIRVQISELTPYSPVTYNYTVTGSGSAFWAFTGSATGNNPSISATVGDTLRFAVSSTNNNTFYLKTAAVGGTGSLVTTGVTNNGTQNNTVIWNTTGLAAGTYYYISAETPNNMVGTITLSPAASTITSTVYSSDVAGFSRSITVLTPPSIVVIDTNNSSYTLSTGSSLILTIDASINSTLSNFINTTLSNITPIVLQWQQSTDNGTTWSNLNAGANVAISENTFSFATVPPSYFKRSVLTLSNLTFSQNGYKYRCLVSYTKDGTTASNSPVATDAISVLINPQIIIIRQPGNGTDTTSTISYNTDIAGSGNATLSVNAYTTASTTLSYSWEYRWSTSTTYFPISPTNPQFDGTPFRLVSGTTTNSPTLNLERIRLSNDPTYNTNLLYLRVVISGLSGEQSITSSDASLFLTQTAVIDNPISSQSIIEDRYGPILNRSSYPENSQTATINAAVDVSINTGLKGPVTMGWQRQYFGETGWTNVGVIKNDYGTENPPPTSTNPTSDGIHSFTTPQLRRSTDHLSKYRMYVTYNSGGASVTTFSSSCTLNVFRTAYIDNNPGDSESFTNNISTFSISASPSSGSTINYSWEYSINGITWSPIVDNSPLLNVTSITFSSYTVTVTCSSAHNLSAGDRVYVSGVTPLTYNGTFTVLSTGLTSTSFTYTVLSIPTSNGIGPFTVFKAPKFSGVNTNTLSIITVSSAISQRYYRCVVSVPDSLASVQTAFGILIIRTDAITSITSINDKQIQEYNSVSWSVSATSTSLSTPSYQWQKSTNYIPSNPTSPSITWNSIVGANSSTYTIPSAVVADAGYYRCLVTTAGSTIAFSNVARLRVFAVQINITQNIATSVSIDEDFPGTELAVSATSTISGVINYQWQIKPNGSSTFVDAPVGFNQTTTTNNTYRILALSRVLNNGDTYRCRITQTGNPNIYYSNECVVTVNRIFNYYADAAIKKVTAGTTINLSLSPSITGTDLPTYSWQASKDGGATWLTLINGVNTSLYNINVDGATSSNLSLASITLSLNNARFRCAVTLNQVTKVTYYRSAVQTTTISPAGSLFYTAIVQLSVLSSIPLVGTYNEQRQKVGAAIGTVICVPKPSDYIEDVSASTDDADRWKIALTGQISPGVPAQGVNASTAPYGPNDRFPGFIEMRGQILKASDFPELARILGNTYGGSISGSSAYPNYQSTDTFRLPCPYGKYLLGTGNVDNNKASPSIFPVYAPNGSSGGQINIAGTMGGEYNFEKQDQLPPGNPNISGQLDGTSPAVAPFLFSVGTHRTEGWENCTIEVETTFIGNTSYTVSDSEGMSRIALSSPPIHTHTINSIAFEDAGRGWAGAGGGSCGATRSFSAAGDILDGPEGVITNTLNPGRTHSHTLSFNANDAGLGGGTGPETTTPGGTGADFSYTSPGTYSFTVPTGANGFTVNHYSGSGGGGGNDAGNPGSGGGASARIVGNVTNIPGGSSFRVIVPFAGGGGTGCAANGPGGGGGGSINTGFGGGRGGNSGGQGCSGSGGGGGGAAFMYCETVGSGPNPAGLQVGTILYIVGGGGGGGGSGFHRGVTNPRFNGQDASTSWASSSINSSSYYSNQAGLVFTSYGESTIQSGKQGGDRSGDGGGGGGGGGGFTGGAGGPQAAGDINAPAGSAGTSAYNSAFFSSAPTLTVGSDGGSEGGSNNTGNTGSAVISIGSASSTPTVPPSTGGASSADHNSNWGIIRGTSNQFLSETINHHFDPDSTAESMGISFPNGTATMSATSRSTFDNNISFYMRNNESIPIQQPYFRLKYLIKAF